GTGIVVFAGEQEERTALYVDLVDTITDVPIDHVEVEIAFEHAGSALHVVPQCLPALGGGRGWRKEARHDAGANHAAVHVGPIEPGKIVVGIGMRRSFEADKGAEPLRVLMREMQTMRPPIEQPTATGLSSSSASATSMIIRT